MTDTMSPQAELSTTLQEADSGPTESSERSVALIGPNETSRRIVARALSGSNAGFVREFAAYPSKLIEVPRILEQNFNVVMIDVDTDESRALELVEALAAAGTTTVMVYSMRNQPDLMMRCMQAGARDFLPLPEETADEATAAEPQPRRDSIHVVEPRVEVPAEAIAPVQPAPAPAAPVAKAKVDAPVRRQTVDERPAPVRVAAEAVHAVAAEPAAPRQAVSVPSFGQPREEDKQPKSKMMVWLLLAVVPVAGLAVAGSIYLRPGHSSAAAPAPAPVQQEAPQANAAAPAETPAAPGAAEVPVAKPSAAEPVSQATAPQPARGVAPDAMNAQLAAPARFGSALKKPAPKEEAAPAGFAPGAMESGSGMPGAAFAHRGVKVAPAVSAISAGVAEGMLIRKTPPLYPKIAKDARVSGTVVIGATISKTGTLEGLHVVSGPPMLANAALEAAKGWRYRPFLLDNQPIEVQTTINVVFNLGG